MYILTDRSAADQEAVQTSSDVILQNCLLSSVACRRLSALMVEDASESILMEALCACCVFRSSLGSILFVLQLSTAEDSGFLTLT